MISIIIWSLFDSGNGSYSKVIKEMQGVVNYSVGIDKMDKNDHFINIDLADYSFLFGEDELINELDKLPKPDILLASPPCESWSVASAMENGNACWKQEKGDSLFQPQTPLSRFTVRESQDYERYQFKPEKSIVTRINGELTIFNTIRIIKRYEPKVYIIENPAHGRIWDYIDKVIGFDVRYENQTRYNNYDYPIAKPTKFGSNVDLKLNNTHKKPTQKFNDFSGCYNERSNIPVKLVKHLISEAVFEVKNKS